MTADVAMGSGEDHKVPRVPLYESSTQYRHWRFSPEQLADIRVSLNTAAVTAIRDAFEADLASSAFPEYLTHSKVFR